MLLAIPAGSRECAHPSLAAQALATHRAARLALHRHHQSGAVECTFVPPSGEHLAGMATSVALLSPGKRRQG